MTNPAYNSEDELLRHFTLGDATAFTTVYKQFYFRVYQYAKRIVPEQEDARDMTADTFVKLWNRRGQFNSLENISAFLLVTVRNGCLDFLKHLRVKTDKQAELEQQLLQNDGREFERLLIKEEFMRLVYAEVEKMPARMREIFLLSYRDGLGPSEIAEKLQLSVNTVSNQKTNAISLLRIALADKPLLLALLFYLETGQRWLS